MSTLTLIKQAIHAPVKHFIVFAAEQYKHPLIKHNSAERETACVLMFTNTSEVTVSISAVMQRVTDSVMESTGEPHEANERIRRACSSQIISAATPLFLSC